MLSKKSFHVSFLQNLIFSISDANFEQLLYFIYIWISLLISVDEHKFIIKKNIGEKEKGKSKF